MFDGKTVTAVFVSLAVIAVLTSGQQLSAPSFEGGGGFNLGSLLPSGGDAAFENRPEPNNSIEADFTADFTNETIQVYNTNITSQGLTEIEAESFTSQNTITLQSFTGAIHLQEDNKVKLVGDAEGYSTSQSTSGESFSMNESHTTSSFEIQTVKLQHSFNQTEGNIEGPSGQSSETAETVVFNSFTGTAVFNLEAQSVQLNGKVDHLESGSFVIN